MIPEGRCHTVVDVFVSVMMSHVLFFQILEKLDLEVSTKVEPEMHRVIEHLREKKPWHEARSEDYPQEVLLKGPDSTSNFKDMPERYDNSIFLVRVHMMDMVVSEKWKNVFFSDLVRNLMLVVKLKSMLLILKECPEDYSSYKV